MPTYLYTWNPLRWEWLDQGVAISEVNDAGVHNTYWSCGRTRKIRAGDFFFLMRLGEHPKGIIGGGTITSEPYEMTHWDTDKAESGHKALGTDVSFRALSDSPILPLADLQARFPNFGWTPQSGGQTVPEEIASEWLPTLVGDSSQTWTDQVPQTAIFSEGKARRVTTTTYDRSPRARRVCIAHHGYDCSVCGFNFQSVYGAIGATYVEVHHLRPISDIRVEYEIDPVRDLRPVCANCHRMLHTRRPPWAIKELITHNMSVQPTARSAREG